MKTYHNAKRRSAFYFLIIFCLLAVSISIPVYLYYAREKIRIQEEIQQQLSTISDLKAEQIVNWRAERRADADVLINSPSVLFDIRRVLAGSGTPAEKREILGWLTMFKKHVDFASIALVDAKGSVLISTEKHDVLGAVGKRHLEEAFQTGETVLSDFHQTASAGYTHLDLIAPLTVFQGRSRIQIGAFFIRIDPRRLLYPLLQSWPSKSRTAETLLVERNGDHVVFLNELRFKKDTTLTFALPLDSEQLPAAMAARGVTGIVEGRDYRGVPVLAAIRSIPGSPWYMISKVDQAEIYAPLGARARTVDAFIVIIVLAAGLGVGFWNRRQSEKLYRERYESELAFNILRKKAAAEMQAQLNFLQVLIDAIPSPVFYKDTTGIYLGCNTAYERFIGLSRKAFIGKTVFDVAPRELAEKYHARDASLFEKPGHQTYESSVAHADGTMHAVIFSKATFSSADGSPAGLVGVITDITERKRAEMILAQQRLQLDEAQRIAHIGSWERDVATNDVAWSEELMRIFGLDPRETRPTFALLLDIIHPDDRDAFVRAGKEAVQENKPYSLEYRIKRRDGLIRYIHARGEVQYDEAGIPRRFRGTAQDITERKRQEQALAESEAGYRTLFDSSSDGIFIIDGKGQFIDANRTAYERLGYTREELLGMHIGELDHPDFTARVPERFEQIRARGIAVFESCHLRKDGSLMPVEVNSRLIEYQGRQVYFSVIRDITERTRAEKALRESEEKYRVLVENAGECIFVAQDGLIRFANLRTAEFIAIGPHELADRPFLDLLHPDDRSLVMDRHVKRQQGAVLPSSYVFRVVRTSGEVRWASLSAVLIEWEGRPATLNFLVDITEQKLAEEALRRNEEQLRLILESAGEAIYGVDPDGKCTFCNPACVRLLGYERPENLLGKDMHAAIHHKKKDGAPNPVDSCPVVSAFRQGHGTHLADELLWRADGTSFPAEIWSFPQMRDGVITGAVVTFLDISERK